MTEKRFVVKISDLGRVIVFKNREVRTPVELEVPESQLAEIKAKVRANGISNYSISLARDKSEEEFTIPEIDDEEEPLEEQEEKPKSLLEEFLD